MIKFVVHVGAVPLGYTSDVTDCELLYGDDEISCETASVMNLRTSGGPPPLPDVILSNSPPPSPLRRSPSQQHFVFPGDTNTTSRARSSSPEPSLGHLSGLLTPPDTPLDVAVPSSFSSSSVTEMETGNQENSVRSSLEHIQEVRRRLQRDPQHQSPFLQQSLPQLTWAVPRQQQQQNSSLQQDAGDHQEEGLREEDERPHAEGGLNVQSQNERFCQVGRDLRQVADQFMTNQTKTDHKSHNAVSFNVTIPEAFSRCVSASIVLLIWWRLFNKFH